MARHIEALDSRLLFAAGALRPSWDALSINRFYSFGPGALRDVLALPNGKALVCTRDWSDGAVTRLLSSGMPDESFGQEQSHTSTYDRGANSLGVDSQGRILGAGHWAVLRWT